MICQICGKHSASVLVRQIADGKAKELYLCRACAKKHHLYSDDRKMHLSLKAVFDGLLPQLNENGKEEVSEGVRPVVCPDCGMPLSRVKKNNRLPALFFLFPRHCCKVSTRDFRRSFLCRSLTRTAGNIFRHSVFVAAP